MFFTFISKSPLHTFVAVKQFRPIILFILKFSIVYGIGSYLYGLYIEQYPNALDPFSWEITREVTTVLKQFFSDIMQQDYPGYALSDIYCSGNVIVRIIEGCNGASTMILFTAFVIAFSGSYKHTLWYIPTGLVIIHIANIFRIFIIGVVTLKKPEWAHFFHDYFFPAAIYGTIFILWVIWVRMVLKQKKNETTEV